MRYSYLGWQSNTEGRRIAAASLAVAVVVLLSACVLGGCSSSTRSVTAYCQTFYRQGTQFRNQVQTSDNNMSQNPLGGIISLLTVPSRLATFFGQLDSVAPPSIEPQVAQIQQAFQQEVNNATKDITNPVGGLLDGLASAIETGPAWTAVNNWTDTNCGPPPGTKWLSGSSG